MHIRRPPSRPLITQTDNRREKKEMKEAQSVNDRPGITTTTTKPPARLHQIGSAPINTSSAPLTVITFRSEPPFPFLPVSVFISGEPTS